MIIRGAAVLACFCSALLALKMFIQYGTAVAGPWGLIRATGSWVPALGIGYHVGVDGLNLGLILWARSLRSPPLVSWEIKEREKSFTSCCWREASSGIRVAGFVHVCFFHELALVPTFIMIGVWGPGQQRPCDFQITLYLGLGALIALAD